MSAAPIYELLGLRVRSPVPLGRASPGGGDVDHEVTVGTRRAVPDDRPPGTLLCELTDDDRQYYAATRTGAGYVVRYFGTCDFEISPDRGAIHCVPGPEVTDDYVGVLLGGGIMAFLLLLDGACVLHASAVTIGGRGIALVGGSGSGKSTLAALLCLDGATLVSDDVLRIELGIDGEVRAVGGVPELRLRDNASGLANRFGPPARTRATADGRTAVAPGPGAPVWARLDAIVLPRLSRTTTATRVVALGVGRRDAPALGLAAPGGRARPRPAPHQFPADVGARDPCPRVRRRAAVGRAGPRPPRARPPRRARPRLTWRFRSTCRLCDTGACGREAGHCPVANAALARYG